MAAPNSSVVLPAFAKLHGENSVYFMRKYSITLGRNTETSKVDLDLSELGGGRGPRVSRHHARIFYDFEKRHFALEVLGKNGCSIQGVSYLPGSDPVKLNSQDLIEIAGKQFYFLLATRSFSTTPAPGAHALLPQTPTLILPGHPGTHDNDTEDQQLLEEERNAVSALVVLMSDICSPGEWVNMENLHLEILERFGENALVRRYLAREDASVSSTETEGRPWRSLLPLLRKHPEYFVMSTVTRGEVTSEYAALVSLVSMGNEP
nr:FHA domain-containing protein FHA2-like [Setaria viridis]